MGILTDGSLDPDSNPDPRADDHLPSFLTSLKKENSIIAVTNLFYSYSGNTSSSSTWLFENNQNTLIF
jgi:hypothetical protein